MHRRNPILHLGELDLACYDPDCAAPEERDAARAEHLAAWPRVADAAIESLDQVSAPVAEALLGGIRGLAAGLTAGPAVPADPARPPWPPRGPRTRAWSRTWNAPRRTAIPIRRSAVPGSPP